MFWSQLRADLDVLTGARMDAPEGAGLAARGSILAVAQNAVTLHQNALTWAPNSSALEP
jgi:hypothetical protein